MLHVCQAQVLQDGWDNVLAEEVRHRTMSGCVRASPSSVCDGTGLFACEDLPSVATLYPVHALGLGSTRMELEFIARHSAHLAAPPAANLAISIGGLDLVNKIKYS